MNTAYNNAKAGNVDEAYQLVKDAVGNNTLADNDRNRAGWIVFYYLKYKMEALTSEDARFALKLYLNIGVESPSILHSQILRLAGNLSEKHGDFKLLNFIALWNPELFSAKDMEPNVYNGKTYPSLFENIISKCIKRGSSLQEILQAFGNNYSGKIFEIYSKTRYFDAYQASKSGNRSEFTDIISKYLDDVQNHAQANEYHSKILSSIIWNLEDSSLYRFKVWFEQWGMSNFRSEDWMKVEGENNIRYDSLAEKAISRYVESLKKHSSSSAAPEFNELLTEALEHFPCDESLLRIKYSLLLEEGDREGAAAQIKQAILYDSKYYLWNELAAVIDDSDLKFACLCKALTLMQEDTFVGKIRFNLAKLLIDKGMLSEAALELKRYEECYVAQQWHLDSSLERLKNLVAGHTPTTDNKSLYRRSVAPADEYIYSDIPSRIMVLVRKKEKVVDNRTKLTFIFNHKDMPDVTCNPRRFGLDPRVSLMTCFEVKTMCVDGRINPVFVKQIEDDPTKYLDYKVAVVDNVNETKSLFHYVVNPQNHGVVHFNETHLRPQRGDSILVLQRLVVKEDRSWFKTIDVRMNEA